MYVASSCLGVFIFFVFLIEGGKSVNRCGALEQLRPNLMNAHE